MLWYKSWLETRFRMLFMLPFAVFPIPLMTLTPHPANPPPLAAVVGSVGFLALYYSLVPLMLGGSGIKTQAFQATKGLHGSMYFTLSMPVSRLRLLATRAGLGILEAFAILAVAPCAAWIIFQPLRTHITPSDLVAYWATLSVCSSTFYFLGVLLSTFLNDLTQNWTSLFGIVLLRWLLSLPHVPTSVNLFRAMGVSSPLFTHRLPWASMGVSLGVSGVLFLIALRIVQSSEY